MPQLIGVAESGAIQLDNGGAVKAACFEPGENIPEIFVAGAGWDAIALGVFVADMHMPHSARHRIEHVRKRYAGAAALFEIQHKLRLVAEQAAHRADKIGRSGAEFHDVFLQQRHAEGLPEIEKLFISPGVFFGGQHAGFLVAVQHQKCRNSLLYTLK